MAGGVCCALSVYLAGQFGKERGRRGGAFQQRRAAREVSAIGGNSAGRKDRRHGGRWGRYAMQEVTGIGGGGGGKTAGPFWAWGRIHHPHPLPRSTALNHPVAFCRQQVTPRLLPSPARIRRAAWHSGIAEKRAAGFRKRRGEIITGNSPGYGGLLPRPGFCVYGIGQQIYGHRWHTVGCGGNDLFSFIASTTKVWY